MDLLPHCNFRHCSVREKEVASCIVEQLTETKVITSLSVAADKVSSPSSCNETECLCYILPIMKNLWNIKSTYLQHGGLLWQKAQRDRLHHQ